MCIEPSNAQQLRYIWLNIPTPLYHSHSLKVSGWVTLHTADPSPTECMLHVISQVWVQGPEKVTGEGLR